MTFAKQNSTLENILDSHCPDFKCMCQNDDLLTTLTYELLRQCEPADQNSMSIFAPYVFTRGFQHGDGMHSKQGALC